MKNDHSTKNWLQVQEKEAKIQNMLRDMKVLREKNKGLEKEVGWQLDMIEETKDYYEKQVSKLQEELWQ